MSREKIIVRRTSILINNYDIGDSYKLEKRFSVWDNLRHCRTAKGMYYDEYNKILYLPRGIDIGILERTFEANAFYEESHDPYDEVEPVLIKYLPRDDVQKEAIEFVLGGGKWISNRFSSQLSVNLNTGKGKTYVAIAMASFLRQRTMMITASVNWINQWKNCIMEYTNIKEDEIYILTGRRSIIQLLKGQKDLKQYKFILSSHTTIRNYGEEKGWESVTELFKFLHIGLKIYDEAHLNFDNMCLIDFFTNTYRTLYLTATPARSDRGENLVYQLALKSIPKIDLFDEKTDPHTKCIAIHYNSHPTPQQVSSCRNIYGFDKLKYIRYITKKQEFYMMLMLLIDFCTKNGERTLIYIGLNEAINTVYQWLCYTFPHLKDEIGIYNSLVPKEIKNEQLSKMIILSTIKSCGTAMDIQGLKYTVNLADPMGSLVLTRQALGRTRADDTYFIDVVDNGFASLRNYYGKKRPIYLKYGKSLNDINVTDEDLLNKQREISLRVNQLYAEQIRNENQSKNLIEVVKRI